MLRTQGQSKIGTDAKHLILFFDVNGTIILEDSKQGRDHETAIGRMLAESYVSKWDESCAEEMTYRRYVEKYLAPGDDNDPIIENNRNKLYRNFIAFLASVKHPLHQEIATKYKTISDFFSSGYRIFNSFVALILYLEKEKIPYTLIFRTFGDDADKIAKELQLRTPLSQFKHFHFDTEELKKLDDKKSAEMLAELKPGEHQMWKDNWPYWHQMGEKYEGGKPYLINLNSTNQISMFFDDHAVNKQIICVRPTSSGRYNQSLLQKELVKQGRIIPANKLIAIENENYFIEPTRKALQNPLRLDPTNFTLDKAKNVVLFRPDMPGEDKRVPSEKSQVELGH